MGDLDLTPGQPRGSETILSEEMWEKVLMNLTDPSDVLNAGKTCVQFKRILHSKTIDAYLAKTLPILTNYMDRKSILKCRSVSKGWMDVVDKFFENYFLGRTIIGPPKALKAFPVTRWACALHPFDYWRRNRDHVRFMREMKDHPRNPFVGRAVHFELGGGRRGEEYRPDFRTVYDFFEMFGKHIWALQLEISERYPIEVEREAIFRFIIMDVFELAPNLKNLYIKKLPLLTVSMRRNEIRALAPAQALEKLEISEAFPQYRDYYAVEDIEEIERAILLRVSNSQLGVLHTRTLDPLRNLNYWPNLRELHFTNTERINEIDIVFRNLRLPKLELLSISLEDMEIASGREWSERGQKIAFRKFFIALHHLSTSSPNLKTLRFDTPRLWDKHSFHPLGFPRGLPCPKNIKTIEIEDHFYRDYELYATSDYSFLLRFPHVENIHIFHLYRDSGFMKHWDYDRREHLQNRLYRAKRNETVKVHEFMYHGRMYESNIWELIPSLKVFSCHFCDTKSRTYTRSSYEQRRICD